MLESQRGFLFIAFAAITFYLFTVWQQEQHPVKAPAANALASITSDEKAVTPAVSDSDVPAVAGLPETTAATDTESTERFVELSSKRLRLVIDRNGGDIVESDLLSYRENLDNGSDTVRLLQNKNGRVFIAQSGISGVGSPDSQTPRAAYQSTIKDQDSDHPSLVLTWQNAEGLQFSKTYRVHDDSNVVDVEFAINNAGTANFVGQVFTQLKRDRVEIKSSSTTMGAFTGAAFGNNEKRYSKYKFSEMDDKALDLKTDKAWIAFMQHYFLAAWVPGTDSSNEITTKVLPDKVVIIGLKQPVLTVVPGTAVTASAKLYLGPKIQSDLSVLSDGLDLTVDYGWLWWIGQPLFKFLNFLHGVLGNWGLAIIFVTIMVKLALFPLSNAQYRSFGKMRKLQPKIEALKERYGDDKQAFGQAMMEMYKTEKVNPLGGCFPLLLQMPVFFALYSVLSESVEMRHAPFYGWIHDLSAMDPYYVLPVLMGISMFITQKLQPVSPTMDPMQQKIMQFMPVMMTVFFIWAPSGLVLYWFMNNLLSIFQQWFITKRMEVDELKKK